MDLGHWFFPTSFDISSAHGFVYRIINMSTGQSYIGKKNFWSITRKAIPGKKRKQKILKESDWKTYCSSSKDLNQDILTLSKSMFQFQILSVHISKQELDYAEAKLQFQLDVCGSKFPDGSKMFYNKRNEVIRFNQYTRDRVKFL